MNPSTFYRASSSKTLTEKTNAFRQTHEMQHKTKSHYHRQMSSALTRAATTYHVFPRLIDALKLRTNEVKLQPELDESLYVFSYENIVGGTRMFVVADINYFFQVYHRSLPEHRLRHSYEVICEDQPCKLYFDLEFSIESNPNLNGKELTTTFIQFILNFLKKSYDLVRYTEDDVLTLDSSSSTKFSRHIIFLAKEHPFRNNVEAGNFVFAALQDIYDSLISHQCNDRFIAENENQTLSPQNGVLSSSLICKNLIAKLVPILSKFDQCTCCDEYSGLRYCDLSKLLVKKPDDTYSWYCDIGVYTKNRSFRLYKSSKYKKEEKFVMVDENKWKPIGNDKEDRERQIFMASLVRYTGPIKGIIPAPMTSRHEQPHPNLILSNSHIRDSCTSNTFGPSPFREIDDFIKGLISKGPCVGSIRKWTLLEQSQTLIYEIANYRYCENVGRHHKSNNIYFVVDLKLDMYRQKCYDPDCKGFKSKQIKLPANLTAWKDIVNESWDLDDKEKENHCSNDHGKSVIMIDDDDDVIMID